MSRGKRGADGETQFWFSELLIVPFLRQVLEKMAPAKYCWVQWQYLLEVLTHLARMVETYCFHSFSDTWGEVRFGRRARERSRASRTSVALRGY